MWSQILQLTLYIPGKVISRRLSKLTDAHLFSPLENFDSVTKWAIVGPQP